MFHWDVPHSQTKESCKYGDGEGTFAVSYVSASSLATALLPGEACHRPAAPLGPELSLSPSSSRFRWPAACTLRRAYASPAARQSPVPATGAGRERVQNHRHPGRLPPERSELWASPVEETWGR